MRWIKYALLLSILTLVIVLFFAEYWGPISAWAKVQQREFQNILAREILDIRSGDLSALFNLLLISGAYGVVHAIGPGHGKVLIGAAALTSEKTARHMAGIGFISSLFQGVTAILITYGILGILLLTSKALIGTAENYLAPFSFIAMAFVGGWIVFRGVRGIAQNAFARKDKSSSCSHDSHHSHSHSPDHTHTHDHSHDHSHTCAADCKHMPSASEVEAIHSWRDALMIILSIGIRPCSGALIVLIITWKFGLLAAGMLSAMCMAVGTGLVVAAAAIFASKIRSLSISNIISRDDNSGVLLAGGVNIGAGLFVIAMSSLFFMNDLRSVSYPL